MAWSIVHVEESRLREFHAICALYDSRRKVLRWKSEEMDDSRGLKNMNCADSLNITLYKDFV